MPLSLRESQLVTELAEALYAFLPGAPHPRADQDLSFPGAARAAFISTPWRGGSKQPALTALLSAVLDRERQRFCPFLVEITRRALTYRRGRDPLTRDEMDRVNGLIAQLGFKIPELHASDFLTSLPRRVTPVAPQSTPAPTSAAPTAALLAELETALVALHGMQPVPRGTAFELFLNDLFQAYSLAPRQAFTLVGEQIDGSFDLDGQVYLLEAKWRQERTGNRDLAAFDNQVGARAAWTRGLFVSYAGFTDEGLEAFARGRQTRIICMDGFDLYHVLTAGLDLADVLRAKARRAAEETRAFVPVRELFPHFG